jgi:hypothetical protein
MPLAWDRIIIIPSLLICWQNRKIMSITDRAGKKEKMHPPANHKHKQMKKD